MTSTISSLFFFNDTATTEIYTLSLHDALPIWAQAPVPADRTPGFRPTCAAPASVWPAIAGGAAWMSHARQQRGGGLLAALGRGRMPPCSEGEGDARRVRCGVGDRLEPAH